MNDNLVNLNSEQIIRNFQLHILSDIELEEPYLSIYNDLNNYFKNLYIYKSESPLFDDYTYYGFSKNVLYIRHDSEYKMIWIYHDIWRILDSGYKIKCYISVGNVLKWYLKTFLNIIGTVDIQYNSGTLDNEGNRLRLKCINS